MLSFLNARSSHPKVSYKKDVLKIKILQNWLKNIRDKVFNKISAQRSATLLKRDSEHMCLL